MKRYRIGDWLENAVTSTAGKWVFCSIGAFVVLYDFVLAWLCSRTGHPWLALLLLTVAVLCAASWRRSVAIWPRRGGRHRS
jgi:hypothetical protein